MADFTDVGSVITNFSDGLVQYAPQIKIALLVFCGLLFVINLRYIVWGTQALIMSMLGYKKLIVVGNDKTFRAVWVDFREDYKLYKEKAYIIDKTEIYHNEYGEPVVLYPQDFTEPVEFKSYKKYVWVDKRTGLPLKDKDGNYVDKLSIKEYVSFHYHKELNEEFKRIEDLIQPTLLDNVVRKQVTITDVMFPSKLLESKRGIDSSLTANVIVRRMKIDSIGWIQKYWRYVMIFGIVVMLLSLVTFALTYGNSQTLDKVLKGISDLSIQLKALLPKTVVTGG
jgi:hypothetical protein